MPKLIRYIKRENIQIVHAHTRVTQVLAFWLQKFTDVKVVTTCHGFYRSKLGRKLLPAWGDICIAISQPVAETLLTQYKLRGTKLRVVHNAIDIAAPIGTDKPPVNGANAIPTLAPFANPVKDPAAA